MLNTPGHIYESGEDHLTPEALAERLESCEAKTQL